MSRLYPCVYCTEDGYCKKFSDEEVTSWCVQSPCKYEKPSNADRIRSMSDEELAELISDRIDCCECEHMYAGEGKPCHNGETCQDYWLDWLKQEVSANDS